MSVDVVIDDLVYKKWHSIYVSISDEHEQAESKLRHIIQRLPHRRNFLDIGAANAALTRRVNDEFTSTCVVEPNEEYNGIYKECGFDYYNQYFLQVDMQQSFDFILCSHVFWLVNHDHQVDFIRKVYSLLNKGGCASFIIPASYGKGFEFFSRFFLDLSCDFNRLNQVFLSELECTIEVIPYTSYLKSTNFDDFSAVCKLFTLESWLHPVNQTNCELQKIIGDPQHYTQKKIVEIEEYIQDELYDEQKREYQLEECQVIVNIWK